jgi:hypothetical protein
VQSVNRILKILHLGNFGGKAHPHRGVGVEGPKAFLLSLLHDPMAVCLPACGGGLAGGLAFFCSAYLPASGFSCCVCPALALVSRWFPPVPFPLLCYLSLPLLYL